MKRRELRYVVRPDGDRFVVWDTVADRVTVNGWRFGQRQYAADAASNLNAQERGAR